jgi:hypothetical protein
MPDWIAIKDSIVLFLEFKKPGWKESKILSKTRMAQIEVEKQITVHGGKYLLINDIDKFMDWCEQNGLTEQNRIL